MSSGSDGEQPQPPVALVTGAGRGIGRAVARAFAAAGYAVMVNDIDAESAESAAAELRERGCDAVAFPCDVADAESVAAMVASAVERWGRVDVLVNNAGIEPRASILDMDPAEWDRVMAVNLRSAFLCTQAAGRVMRAAGRGAIVNMASIAGKASPLPLRSAYAASKAGMVGFTKEAAREFAAYGIRVNAICPGVIVTEMTAHARSDPAQMTAWLSGIPLARLGEVEEVAALAVFLCSDAASYIIGQAIQVDGGRIMA
ncbi:MAG: SDR family NAD(P)-dependent oxidoreductase [Anaerolineae bacterium]